MNESLKDRIHRVRRYNRIALKKLEPDYELVVQTEGYMLDALEALYERVKELEKKVEKDQTNYPVTINHKQLKEENNHE